MQTVDILESISGGFFALDTEYRFTYWNRAAEEGTGFTRAEVLGRHVFEIFPNAEHDELGECYRRAMKTNTFQTLITCYRDARYEKWFDFRIYPGESGLSVFLQDVTDQKREELERAALLEVSHVINSGKQIDEFCAHFAQALRTRYGLPMHAALLYLYRPLQKQLVLMAPDTLPAPLQQSIASIPLEHAPMYAVVEAARLGSSMVTADIDRSILYAHAPELVITSEKTTLVVLPLKVDTELVGVLELQLTKERSAAERELPFLSLLTTEAAVGISRRTLMDELRVKNVDLEIQRAQTLEANDTLKRFLAFFSHELRSPLNSVIGYSELIRDTSDRLTPATLAEYGRTIYSSGSHLLHLINDILDLSKIEAGKMELHFAAVPIAPLLESVRETVRPRLEAKNMTFDLSITDDVEELVVDEVRLRQILLNLVTNAIKFSYDDSRIIVNVKRVQSDIEFTVQDFGCGITKEDQALLFKPFQQTAVGAKKNEGTGLGLSITKKLVELHGGSIFVVSEFQEGTTFIVRMPMMVKAESEAARIMEAIAAAHGSKAPRRVLIVEDKPHAYTLLRTYMQDAGYETEIAVNGVEALEKAKLWKPDVITLDILLPVKDGWQVLRELKEHPLCREIPVIIISMVDERNVGFSLGAAEYFVKPVQKDSLLHALKRVAERHPYVANAAKILVIDDDPSSTDLVQVILESEGCTVLKANNGRDGLRMAEEERPDLILLDLVMPELSGFNVAYQLKHNLATYTIPVMIMTSMEIDDETRRQLEGFVVGLMKKSGFTKRDLLNEIATINNNSVK
ncbi:MAG: response regulator [Acidobacteriota bacterium]